ncbi:MAG: response regulator [Anaerolineae bacterium]|nr:response regulator [Anaerolineae bacterium]
MKKILVIEDEAMLRDNILEWLALEDFEGIGAPDGKTGVAHALQHQPDLIICDVMMPMLDGFGVSAALQADPRTRSIPIVFLTASSDAHIMERSEELGVVDYVSKPFQFEDLLATINRHLAN